MLSICRDNCQPVTVIKTDPVRVSLGSPEAHGIVSQGCCDNHRAPGGSEQYHWDAVKGRAPPKAPRRICPSLSCLLVAASIPRHPRLCGHTAPSSSVCVKTPPSSLHKDACDCFKGPPG